MINKTVAKHSEWSEILAESISVDSRCVGFPRGIGLVLPDDPLVSVDPMQSSGYKPGKRGPAVLKQASLSEGAPGDCWSLISPCDPLTQRFDLKTGREQALLMALISMDWS